jgi:hypothetical protein
MTTINKDDSVFYYSIPKNRAVQIIAFGWCGIWHGNLYTNNFDLNLVALPEKIAEGVGEILIKMVKNRDDAFTAIAKNLGEKGSCDRTINELMKTYGGADCATKDIAELKAHLIADKRIDDAIKAKLQ